MKRHWKLTTVLFLSLAARQGTAAQLEGVTMPDKVAVSGMDLPLNGIGIRTATIFSVKVYVAGLYVKQPAHDEEAVLAAPGPKQLRMEFMRDVGAEKIAGAWDDAFEKTKDQFKDDIEKLKGLMPTIKKGDRMAYTFFPDAVEVSVNDQVKGRVSGGAFGRAVLASWIGEKPPTKELKRGLLGEKKGIA